MGFVSRWGSRGTSNTRIFTSVRGSLSAVCVIACLNFAYDLVEHNCKVLSVIPSSPCTVRCFTG
jgi:hypothetical protein